jgi:hypothetical protein
MADRADANRHRAGVNRHRVTGWRTAPRPMPRRHPSMSAKDMVETYCLRWSLEVTFQETKGHLGLEGPQNRTELAVQRTAPLALCLYSLVILW